MNSSGNRGMEITFPTKAMTKKSWFLESSYYMLVSYILFAAIFQALLQIFDIKCHALWLQLIAAAITVIVNLFYEKKVVLPVVVLAETVIFAVCMVLKTEILIQGMNIMVNQILHVLGIEKNLTFLQYAVNCSESQYPDYVFFFLLFPVTLFAVLCIVVVRSYTRAGFVLCIGTFVLWLYMQKTDAPLLSAGLLLCIFLLAGAAFVGNTRWKNVQGMGMTQQLFRQGIVMILLFAAVMAVFLLVPETKERAGVAENLRQGMTHIVRDIRYEKNIPNTFTQGDFTRLTDLELYEVPALNVKMDEPDSYYLRGFVGSNYTKNCWEELGKDKIYDHYPLYYWLKKNQFDELTQLSGMEALTAENAVTTEMRIENLNANSRYLYVPYELSEVLSDSKDIFAAGQGNLLSEKLFGHRDYSCLVSDNLLADYPKMASKLSDEEYKQQELNERAWVYDTYLEIPGEVKATLTQILGEQKAEESGHVTYQEAEKLIKAYLEANITYSMEIEPWNQNVDFVTDFLKNSKTGYSVHYATAATLMFRYCGIPSRYVEGYLVTPKDVLDKKSGEVIEIQGKNGHAWTEIYQDGIGWIPVEVTPAYYGIMEVAQIPPGTAQNGTKKDGPQEEMGDTPQDVAEAEQALEPKENDFLTWLIQAAGLILLILLGLGIAGSILFFLLRRRHARKKRASQFGDENYSVAVCRMFQYIEALLTYEGIFKKRMSPRTYREGIEAHISRGYAKQFEKIWEICQYGAYSTHVVSAEQRQLVYEYQEKLLEKITENKKWYQKWKMKYIKCLY